jgi:UDP-N-acetylglucosamine 2-epimerase
MEPCSQNINVGPFALRTSTERQEAVDAGFAELVGVRPKPVVKRVRDWIEHGSKVPAMKSPFGDGHAAERSVEILQDAGYC